MFSISKYTIRHYIDINLLVPKQRKENGYYLLMKTISINYIKS
ncbi:MerR family DNA-binding transcriptional regulator [Enterococcus faecalis]|nr:MerR family DNA-binding transcriptional regulator [Enterococcus faecalis]